VTWTREQELERLHRSLLVTLRLAETGAMLTVSDPSFPSGSVWTKLRDGTWEIVSVSSGASYQYPPDEIARAFYTEVWWVS